MRHTRVHAPQMMMRARLLTGAMTAFGWVTSPEPRQYIGDMLNAVPVYGRQILAVKISIFCVCVLGLVEGNVYDMRITYAKNCSIHYALGCNRWFSM
jgi:hypothetical protein